MEIKKRNPIFNLIVSIYCLFSIAIIGWTLLIFRTHDITGHHNMVYSILLVLSIVYGFYELFTRKNKLIILTFIMLLIETVFFLLETDEFRTGYVTHALYLISILYYYYSDRPLKIVDRVILYDNKWFLVFIGVILYLSSVIYNNGFHTEIFQSLFGDKISTWYLSGWDQGAYLRMTKQIFNNEWFFNGYSGGFRYGIGYPILAVPFNFIYPQNPFLILNGILWLICGILFHQTLSPRTSYRYATIISLVLFLTTPMNNISKDFSTTFLIPFNNTIGVVLSFYCLYLLYGINRVKNYHLILGGAVYGLMFASRYGDVIYFLPLVVALILKGCNNIHSAIRKGMLFTIGATPLMILTLVSHKIFYGGFFETYLDYNLIQDGKSFFPSLYDWKLHFYKFSELFLFPHMGISSSLKTSAFLSSMSYFFVALLSLNTKYIKQINFRTILVIAFIIGNIYYFSSTGATSAYHIRYHCLRYYTPIIPFIGFFSFRIIYDVLKDKTLINNSYKKIIATTVILISLITLLSIPKINALFTPKVHLIPKYSRFIDYVSMDPHPNYKKDNKEDLLIDLEIHTPVPLYLWMVKVEHLDGAHQTWISSKYELEPSEKELWGVGIINPYGSPVNYKLRGDNQIYRNYLFVDNKDITIALPLDRPLFGAYKIVIKTNLGEYSALLNVNGS